MAKQPSKPQAPTLWDIFKAAAKAKPLGTIEAADEDEAIEKAAKEFRQHATKLIAVHK
jgi:1,2-phenylacetyl-CoA epoxidase PaaB subunit